MKIERDGARVFRLRGRTIASITDAEKVAVLEDLLAARHGEAAALRKRVTSLLDSNNREVERRRDAERQRDELGEGLIHALNAANGFRDRALRAERVIGAIVMETGREPDVRSIFAACAEGARS